LSAGFNQKFGIWNAAIGKKFLKKNAGELKLSVFDLLKQNQSISRAIDASYIEDAQSVVLQQYFMLTFTYSLKNFGKAKPSTKTDNKEEINRMMQPR
jgi:Outer membrane protein beta-barrel family